ncbi:MAG: hypothetical protein H7246_22565, partial [Phycisphaerae bacterium]|nr:hypothetical protein [Saprospiraceae bacterium]
KLTDLHNGKLVFLTQETIGLPDNKTDLKIGMMHSDFEIDHAWGVDGFATLNVGHNEYGSAAGAQPDGKIIVFGATTPANNPEYESSIFIGRFTAEGLIDSTFGFQGWRKPDIQTWFDYRWQDPIGLVVFPDGKFLIGAAIRRKEPSDKSHFFFAKYLSNGSIDQDFGTDGYIYQDIGAQTTVLQEMLLDDQGRLIAVGIADYSLTVMARYLPNGQLDNTFSGDGLFTTNFMLGNTSLVQPDGKILVGGNEYNINNDQTRFMRLTENGNFDNSFSGDGKVTFNFVPNEEQIFDLDLQANGKILFSGFKNSLDQNYLARLYSGLVVATEEPLAATIKPAKVTPSLIYNDRDITIAFPHSGLADPTAILIDLSGKTALIELKDAGDELHISTQIPTQLSPGLYHILFVGNHDEVARASFIKM